MEYIRSLTNEMIPKFKQWIKLSLKEGYMFEEEYDNVKWVNQYERQSA